MAAVDIGMDVKLLKTHVWNDEALRARWMDPDQNRKNLVGKSGATTADAIAAPPVEMPDDLTTAIQAVDKLDQKLQAGLSRLGLSANIQEKVYEIAVFDRQQTVYSLHLHSGNMTYHAMHLVSEIEYIKNELANIREQLASPTVDMDMREFLSHRESVLMKRDKDVSNALRDYAITSSQMALTKAQIHYAREAAKKSADNPSISELKVAKPGFSIQS